MMIVGNTELPRTRLVAVLDGKRVFSVLRDPSGPTWCYECAAESCKHTEAVASAVASGTAPAPVRRKASGGKRADAGRPKGAIVGTDTERFWKNVNSKNKHPDDCWIWKRGTHGHPQLFLLTDGRHVAVHRWAYAAFIGCIPEGLVIDHLCAVQKCVNPQHLEAVTAGENVRRGSKPHFEMRGLSQSQ